MWTAKTARPVILSVRQFSGMYNFCVGVTGSILWDGLSGKDLDLVFYPMLKKNPDPEPLMNGLRGLLELDQLKLVNHEIDCKLVFTGITKGRKRIDFFFPGYYYIEFQDKFHTWGEEEGSGGKGWDDELS